MERVALHRSADAVEKLPLGLSGRLFASGTVDLRDVGLKFNIETGTLDTEYFRTCGEYIGHLVISWFIHFDLLVTYLQATRLRIYTNGTNKQFSQVDLVIPQATFALRIEQAYQSYNYRQT